MNSLIPFVIMLCLLPAGCAKSNQHETATAEQPAEPHPIRRPEPPKSILPAPHPRKQIDPDTRDYGLTKTAPSSRGQGEQGNLSVARTTPTPPRPVDLRASSEPVTASDQSESDEAVLITGRVRQALVADQTLSFLAKNVVIVTNYRHTVLQGRVLGHMEAERVRDIATRITTSPIEDRLVFEQDSG